MRRSARNRAIAFAAAAALWLTGMARGDNVTGADELISREIPVVEATLPNGLQIFVEEDPFSPIVAIRIYVKAGTIYEGKYAGTGISHYFEHLMAGGTTTTRTEADSNKLLQELGGMSNAYTTKDHTCFYINTSGENFGKALELLSDWVINCTLEPLEVDRERGVISEEIRMGENEPSRVVMKLFNETAFRVHPERLPTIGYIDTFLKLTRDDLVAYYRENYVPNNMVLVVAGDVKAASVLDKAQEVFGKLERKPIAAPVLPEEPLQLDIRQKQMMMPTKVGYMVMGFHTVSIYSPDLYPLDLISFMMTNGRSSRLYKRVKEELQLVHSIDSWSYTPAYDAGIFGVFSVLEPEKAGQAQQAIVDELERLKTEPISDEELAKVKRQKISDLIMGMQTAEGRAERLGIDVLMTGDPYFSWKYTKRIQEVTPEQIVEAAKRYFTRDDLTVVTVGPEAPAPEATAAPSEEKGEKGGVREVKLQNGITLLIKPVPTVPVVSIQAHFTGGVRYETAKTNGAFNLMTRMMLRGAGERSSDDIARELDSMGAAAYPIAGNNSFSMSMISLSLDFKQALSLLADIVMRPTFPEQHFGEEQATVMARIRQQQDNWDAEAFRLFRNAMFREHPYGLDPLGEMTAVSALTREALVKLHDAYCRPDNMVLAIFGAVNPDAAEKAAREAFGGFSGKAAAGPAVPAEPALTEDIRRVVYNEQTQAVVVLGFRGITLDSEDRYVMSVIDALASGVGFPSGRLQEALRMKRDLVYLVHAVNWSGLDPGSFYVIAQTAPATVEEVVSIIKGELDKLAAQEVSADELELAKKVCVTAYDMSHQTAVQQAQEAALFELYGLGYDYEDKYPDEIKKVTAQDVLKAARKYFQARSVLVITRPKPGG